MANISDVAKEAGVSEATVSRYFNNNKISVSEEKRERIKKAIKKLSYQPNEAARALSKKSSKVIGIIIPSISNSFFAELYKVIDDAASQYGYRVMLCNAENIEKEKEFIYLLRSFQAEGIITATGNCEEIYRSVSTPVISIDRRIKNVRLHVSTDNFKGGQLAAKHLYDCGCKKVAFIGAFQESESQRNRRLGFQEKADEMSMNMAAIFTPHEDVRGAIDVFVDDLKNFDGIFAWNDDVAVNVLNSFSKANIKVPDDVQLIGFDNTYISSIFIPTITTISQDLALIGKKSVELLIKSISGDADFEKEAVIDVKLIKRETTSYGKNLKKPI